MPTGQSPDETSTANTGADAMIAFDAVRCIRGGNMLFENLSFTLASTGALRVSGPNGAGKSSLLRLAAGLLDPVAGTVTRSARMSLTDERAALDPDRSVAQALRWWARLDGASEGALARTIAGGASLWLLDEPANGLDAAAIPLLEAAIARHRAAGGAVMIATHIALALPDAQQITLGAAVPV
jgi:heme exporter protein A